MSRYSNITNEIWRDKEVRQLDPEQKLLYLYLLTSPQCNSAGLYRLSPDDVTHDLAEGYAQHLTEEIKLWRYDVESETVFLPNYLKYNTAKTALQYKGLNSSVRTLSWNPLIVHWLYAVNRYCGQKAFEYIEPSILRYAAMKSKEMDKCIESITVSLLLENYSTLQYSTVHYSTVPYPIRDRA